MGALTTGVALGLIEADTITARRKQSTEHVMQAGARAHLPTGFPRPVDKGGDGGGEGDDEADRDGPMFVGGRRSMAASETPELPENDDRAPIKLEKGR